MTELAVRFAKDVIDFAGRWVARSATGGEDRKSLDWVERRFFKAVVHELEKQGLAHHVIADMFGISRRTLLRRIAKNDGSLETNRKKIRLFIENGPTTLSELLTEFPHLEADVVSSLVKDLTKIGLIEKRGQTLIHISIENQEDVEQIVRGLRTTEADLTVDEVVETFGLPKEIVEPIWEAPEFGWTPDSVDSLWIMLRIYIERLDRMGLQRSRGNNDLTAGALWQINLRDKPAAVESKLRKLVAKLRDEIGEAVGEYAEPSKVWHKEKTRFWSAAFFEVITDEDE